MAVVSRVDIHKTEKVSAAEVVLTKLHAGASSIKPLTKFPAAFTELGSRLLTLWLKLWRSESSAMAKSISKATSGASLREV